MLCLAIRLHSHSAISFSILFIFKNFLLFCRIVVVVVVVVVIVVVIIVVVVLITVRLSQGLVTDVNELMSRCIDAAVYLPVVNERVVSVDEPRDTFVTDTTQSTSDTAVAATQHQWTGTGSVSSCTLFTVL